MVSVRAPRLALLGLALLPAACVAPASEVAPFEAEIRQLTTWMTGSFSSSAQALEAPEDYFDIRLFMVPIWEDRADGPWLYIEQSAAVALERPYRQRVYRLSADGDSIRSDVYTLPGDPLEYAGAWQTPERFRDFGPEDLALRGGCSIYLEPTKMAYVGSTRGQGCASSLADAAYATSIVSIQPNVLESWDRGFNAAGEQVWGAEKGAYHFVRDAQ
ncbi:MAG: chromophore lyase CpcT/CpeT [Planctomycetota bacterium]